MLHNNVLHDGVIVTAKVGQKPYSCLRAYMLHEGIIIEIYRYNLYIIHKRLMRNYNKYRC